jgi:hypothetical protein
MKLASISHSTMSADDGKQRLALLNYGKCFHIQHADISFTTTALKKLGPLFASSNIDLTSIRTLSQLSAAYLAWQPPTGSPKNKLVALVVGSSHIPKQVPGPARLERQLLLTYAPYIDIHHADIVLNAAGEAAVSDYCSTLGITPQTITTLIQLAQLKYDFSEHAMRATVASFGQNLPAPRAP